MTKKINSAQVLYHRKSPPTYEMLRTRFFKNCQEVVASGDKLRKEFSTDAEWLAFLNSFPEGQAHYEDYREAKGILERRRADTAAHAASVKNMTGA